MHGHRGSRRDRRMPAKWRGELIRQGTHERQLIAKLNPRADEPLIHKQCRGALTV